MNILDRLKTGITLTVDSLKIMRNNPRLFLFPLISGLAGLLFLVTFLGVTFGLAAIEPEGGVLVGLFLVYLGLTFITSFFAAALVHETRDAILKDSQPSLEDGIKGAWEVKNQIAVWALISATVGVIFNSLENSDSSVGRVLGAIFGLAWTVMTFLIIPVIVFEKPGIGEMFKRSAGAFRDTWGETAISLVGVQLVSAIVTLPLIFLGVLFIEVNLLLAIGLILFAVLAGFLIGQTLQGVIKTTLYLYATEGARPEEFDNVDFDDLADDENRSSATI